MGCGGGPPQRADIPPSYREPPFPTPFPPLLRGKGMGKGGFRTARLIILWCSESFDIHGVRSGAGVRQSPLRDDRPEFGIIQITHRQMAL